MFNSKYLFSHKKEKFWRVLIVRCKTKYIPRWWFSSYVSFKGLLHLIQIQMLPTSKQAAFYADRDTL
jgi:hypothetical protein